MHFQIVIQPAGSLYLCDPQLSVSFSVTAEFRYCDVNLLTLTFHSGYYASGKALKSRAGNIAVTAPAALAVHTLVWRRSSKAAQRLLGLDMTGVTEPL